MKKLTVLLALAIFLGGMVLGPVGCAHQHGDAAGKHKKSGGSEFSKKRRGSNY